MAAPVTVHLVRHGETSSYESDAGLTDLGVRQVAERGRVLARRIPTERLLGVQFAPTARTRETAEVWLDAFRTAHEGAWSPRWEAREARDFANLSVRVGDDQHDPTAVRHLLGPSGAVDRESPPEPGWMVEARRFWVAHDVEGDAMAFWLRTPLLWHESPASVVHRMLAASVGRSQSATEAGDLVVCGHSGCLRAVVAWASGSDPGEPRNTEVVEIITAPGATELTIRFREEQWQMALPDDLRERASVL